MKILKDWLRREHRKRGLSTSYVSMDHILSSYVEKYLQERYQKELNLLSKKAKITTYAILRRSDTREYVKRLHIQWVPKIVFEIQRNDKEK